VVGEADGRVLTHVVGIIRMVQISAPSGPSSARRSIRQVELGEKKFSRKGACTALSFFAAHDSPIFPASCQDLRVSRGCERKLAHVNCIQILISEELVVAGASPGCGTRSRRPLRLPPPLILKAERAALRSRAQVPPARPPPRRSPVPRNAAAIRETTSSLQPVGDQREGGSFR
jgi:hypothetical protein